jgi:L-glyceraldehyde 3-phosphate reductase
MSHLAAPDRYDTMAYRRAGRSGLLLPALSLGLWQNFGETRPFEVQREIVLHAFDRGITHFDLANNYGPRPGAAEETFGRVLAADLRPYRDELLISTKAGYTMWDGPYGDWGSRKYLLSSLDQSLRRMGLDYVDVFYHHRPDPLTPIDETIGALVTAIQQGKALYAAISNYSPEQTLEAVAAAERHGIRLVLHQPSYSMFNRHVEGGLLDTLDATGLGGVVFSPLQQGLLTDRYLAGDIPADSRAASSPFLDASRVTADYLERARALDAIARRRGQTLAQLALSWVLRHDQVTSAIIGASSVRQLDQNLVALSGAHFSADELAEIDRYAVDGTALR